MGNVEANQPCGSTVESTQGSGSPPPPLMATTGQGTTTGCGGRQDPAMGEFWVARVWMRTATGDSTGTKEAPPMTGAPTLTMDHQHSLKLKMSMSVTSLLQGRTRLFSTTRFTATVSSSFCPG